MNKFALLLLLVPTLVFARLGETLEECEARYGPLLKTLHNKENAQYPIHLFQKGNIAIGILFFNGKSAEEDFTPAGDGTLSETQIQEILAANAEGSSWTIDRRSSGNGFSDIRVYSRADGAARADYQKSTTNDSLTLIHLDFDRELKKPASGF